jgi:hypothetical protein
MEGCGREFYALVPEKVDTSLYRCPKCRTAGVDRRLPAVAKKVQKAILRMTKRRGEG